MSDFSKPARSAAQGRAHKATGLAGMAIGTLVLAAMAAGAPAAHAAGDAAAGKDVFGRCAICHAIEPGRVKLGPSLFGVVGRKAGSAEGYSYSEAMQNYGQVWTEANLDSFLSGPQKAVPHTKMSYPGVADATDRANLIAYLATLK